MDDVFYAVCHIPASVRQEARTILWTINRRTGQILRHFTTWVYDYRTECDSHVRTGRPTVDRAEAVHAEVEFCKKHEKALVFYA